jgi:chromosome segregation ATPase
MTVKEYAAEQHISQQAVYSKIRRNSEKLKSHIFKQNGKLILDKTAQEILMPVEGNCRLASKANRLENMLEEKTVESNYRQKSVRKLEGECDNLKNQLSERDSKIASLESELSAEKAKTAELEQMLADEKAKTAEMEKRITELTDKALSIAEIQERLDRLFKVFEDNANTGVVKKVGDLLFGKH